jgi:hypothetical protein
MTSDVHSEFKSAQRRVLYRVQRCLCPVRISLSRRGSRHVTPCHARRATLNHAPITYQLATMSTKGRSVSPPSRDVDMDMDRHSDGKPDAKVVVVTNLTRNVVETHLQSIFGFYGEVVKIELPIYAKCVLPLTYSAYSCPHPPPPLFSCSSLSDTSRSPQPVKTKGRRHWNTQMRPPLERPCPT